jgi:hypothetical protein
VTRRGARRSGWRTSWAVSGSGWCLSSCCDFGSGRVAWCRLQVLPWCCLGCLFHVLEPGIGLPRIGLGRHMRLSLFPRFLPPHWCSSPRVCLPLHCLPLNSGPLALSPSPLSSLHRPFTRPRASRTLHLPSGTVRVHLHSLLVHTYPLPLSHPVSFVRGLWPDTRNRSPPPPVHPLPPPHLHDPPSNPSHLSHPRIRNNVSPRLRSCPNPSSFVPYRHPR